MKYEHLIEEPTDQLISSLKVTVSAEKHEDALPLAMAIMWQSNHGYDVSHDDLILAEESFFAALPHVKPASMPTGAAVT